jgi:hypothetical protein
MSIENEPQVSPAVSTTYRRHAVVLIACVLWTLGSSALFWWLGPGSSVGLRMCGGSDRCETRLSTFVGGAVLLGTPVAFVVGLWAIARLIAGSRLVASGTKTFIFPLLLCAFVIWAGSFDGVVLLFAMLIVAVWTVWSLIKAIENPEQRIPRAIKFAMWIVALAVGCLLLSWNRSEMRSSADRIVQAVERYHRLHGAYPEELPATGMDPATKPHQGIRYHAGNQKASLHYFDPIDPTEDVWSYDFEAKRWMLERE